ncbi:MAG: DUF4347 domain-containing protein, partial [Proteobacteria bacterium]|nr:DUF4347 domain-containing protein [Pseudomonadota bacterium]
MSTTPFNADNLVIHQRTELVFIDGNVPDIDTLIASLGANKEVHILDASLDGLTQIASLLDGRSDIDALHIISHGAAGQAQLGTLTLDSSTATARAADLAAIGSHLTNSGDILFYGCDIGASEAGQSFIEQLAITTGADIAASDDPTGSTALGGDWNLEIIQGNIESPLAVDAKALQDFFGLLAYSGTLKFGSGGTAGGATSTVANGNFYSTFATGYTLKMDGVELPVGQNSGLAYINSNNLSVTFSFNNSAVFDPTSISLQSYTSSSRNLRFTTDLGGTLDFTLTGWGALPALNLATLPAGISTLTLTNQTTVSTFA